MAVQVDAEKAFHYSHTGTSTSETWVTPSGPVRGNSVNAQMTLRILCQDDDKEAKREFCMVSLSFMPRAQLNASSQSHNNLDDPMPGMSIANNI